jgi:predicted acylesterase/phospholipase RssA
MIIRCAKFGEGGGQSLMQIFAVSCELSAVSGDADVTRDSWRIAWKVRLRFAVLLAGFVFLFALEGCAGLAAGEPDTQRQSLAHLPVTIRTLGTDQRFSALSSTVVAQQLRALRPGEPLNILALSCGAGAGAFGAGAVAGLTRSGARPDFAVVTGVSTGALIAPYAFLGSAWDARLIEAFANGARGDFLQPRGLGALFGSSVYRGAPLKRLVDAYASDEMIQAIARETDRGRLLLVATTNVATGEPVVWDLGAIARNGGPNARTLFRDVLVASASIPGMFPPVTIQVREDGAAHDEVHVDGAATMPFFVPRAFAEAPRETLTHTPPAAVYVLIDGQLGETARATRLTARAIFTRSVDAGLHQMMMTTLELTAATAQLQGATLQYSAIPSAYPLPDGFDFHRDTMRPLLNYAYECAQAGRLWTAFRRTDDEPGSAGSAEEARKVPCPADEFVGLLTSR